MAYQPLKIVIREAKLTDFMTDLSVIFNTNDSKLKTEIEKIVNGFQFNTSTGVMGEPDSSGLIPLTQINTRTLFCVLPSNPTTGWKLGFMNTYNSQVSAGVEYSATATDPWTVNLSTYIYSLVAGTPSAGYRAAFDSLTVATSLRAITAKFSNLQLTDASGLLDCLAPAQFSGNIINKGGLIESVLDTSVIVQQDLSDPTVFYRDIAISRNMTENIFVQLQFDTNAYSGGWSPSMSRIELRLFIDPNTPNSSPMPGQSFNLILRGVIDISGNPIDVHPSVDVVVVPKQSVPGVNDLDFKNYGANVNAHTPITEIVFIPKASDVAVNSLDTYGVNLSMLYNKETQPGGSIYGTQTNMVYIRNHFSKVD